MTAPQRIGGQKEQRVQLVYHFNAVRVRERTRDEAHRIAERVRKTLHALARAARRRRHGRDGHAASSAPSVARQNACHDRPRQPGLHPPRLAIRNLLKRVLRRADAERVDDTVRAVDGLVRLGLPVARPRHRRQLQDAQERLVVVQNHKTSSQINLPEPVSKEAVLRKSIMPNRQRRRPCGRQPGGNQVPNRTIRPGEHHGRAKAHPGGVRRRGRRVRGGGNARAKIGAMHVAHVSPFSASPAHSQQSAAHVHERLRQSQ